MSFRTASSVSTAIALSPGAAGPDEARLGGAGVGEESIDGVPTL
jgi:hypothetical protein